jgi:hypothetical protein
MNKSKKLFLTILSVPPLNEDLNLVFANHNEEDEIYLLTTIEITEAQQKNQELKVYYKRNAKTPKEDVCFQLIEDTKVLCKNDK